MTYDLNPVANALERGHSCPQKHKSNERIGRDHRIMSSDDVAGRNVRAPSATFATYVMSHDSRLASNPKGWQTVAGGRSAAKTSGKRSPQFRASRRDARPPRPPPASDRPRARRAQPKSRRDNTKIAQGQRGTSAALGNAAKKETSSGDALYQDSFRIHNLAFSHLIPC